jgi:hypothetical protein
MIFTKKEEDSLYVLQTVTMLIQMAYKQGVGKKTVGYDPGACLREDCGITECRHYL